jgi:hypothetical protein
MYPKNIFRRQNNKNNFDQKSMSQPTYLLVPYKGGTYITRSTLKNKVRKQINNFLYRQVSTPQLAYLHIPKTGGTYIAQSESNRIPVLMPICYLNHAYVVDRYGVANPLYYSYDQENEKLVILLSELKQYTVFATVRNIFSWLVSYAWHAGGFNPKYKNPDYYDFDAANKGFDYLVKTIANRDDIWPNRKFIFCQLFSNNGFLVADWINRTETLDDDLKALASINNIAYNPRTKQRIGHKTDYREYYTESLIDLVYATWGRELRLFGYDFDGIMTSSNVLYKGVSENEKENIQYFWNEDKLSINNMVVV